MSSFEGKVRQERIGCDISSIFLYVGKTEIADEIRKFDGKNVRVSIEVI